MKEFLVKSFKSKIINSKDFSVFTEECKNTSQICHCFEHFLNMVSLLKQLIAADHNGVWESHPQKVQSILPFFSESDSINYWRYGSLFLEQMRRLPQDIPEVYDKFIYGLFFVK